MLIDMLEGFAGTGESRLARAIAKQACKHEPKAFHTRMPDMPACRAERMGAGWPGRKALNGFAGCKG